MSFYLFSSPNTLSCLLVRARIHLSLGSTCPVLCSVCNKAAICSEMKSRFSPCCTICVAVTLTWQAVAPVVGVDLKAQERTRGERISALADGPFEGARVGEVCAYGSCYFTKLRAMQNVIAVADAIPEWRDVFRDVASGPITKVSEQKQGRRVVSSRQPHLRLPVPLSKTSAAARKPFGDQWVSTSGLLAVAQAISGGGAPRQGRGSEYILQPSASSNKADYRGAMTN